MEEEEATFWEGETDMKDILIREWCKRLWILGGMVKVVDEEQWLNISDDDVDGEEEPGAVDRPLIRSAGRTRPADQLEPYDVLVLREDT